MTLVKLDSILSPKVVAVVGGSSTPGSVGEALLRNLRDGGFSGEIVAVNPHQVKMSGIRWCATLDAMDRVPDLAVVCVPAASVVGVIAGLGARGVPVAVVVSAGLAHDSADYRAMLETARAHKLRIIGPNGIGILMPHARLNASFAQSSVPPGRLAFMSQSGALVSTVLDWARTNEVGLSGIVSAGDMADASLGDFVDLFAADPHTTAILLYIEGVTDPENFVSAVRAASRTKPVVVLKGGHSTEAAAAAHTHTGAMSGSPDIYEAVFRRAGALSVGSLGEFLDVANLLNRSGIPAGDRVAIVTNGGGAGVLATDALMNAGLHLSSLTGETVLKLARDLPSHWTGSNPIDVAGDATADRFRSAIQAVAHDPQVDTILVMHCATALSAGEEIAKVVAELAPACLKPIIACWLGDSDAAAARPVLDAANVPLFTRPEDAVRSLAAAYHLRRDREARIATPSTVSIPVADLAAAKAIIAEARRNRRVDLNEVESKAVLAAMGVPVVPTRFVHCPSAVGIGAIGLREPLAVKVVSPDIIHKSDIGGVALSLPSARAAEEAARAMAARIHATDPTIRIDGYAVEEMAQAKHGRELIVGLSQDKTFGAMLMIGAGGKAVEIIHDRTFELPPLDDGLARAMIDRIGIASLLHGYCDEPAADIPAIIRVLNALSRIAVDLPDVLELDINPLLVHQNGAVALDARIRVSSQEREPRLTIAPPPDAWSGDLTTRSGLKLHVRPAVPRDREIVEGLFSRLSPEDLRHRFLSSVRQISADQLSAMTQLDYRRTMNFLAFAPTGRLIASSMLSCDGTGLYAEVAVATDRDWKAKGVSWTLLEHTLQYARSIGIETVASLECADNAEALQLEREMGFTVRPQTDCPTELVVEKALA